MVEAAGVELFWGVDNTWVIDSRNRHNGQKGPIARSIVRLLYENTLTLNPANPTVPIASYRFVGLNWERDTEPQTSRRYVVQDAHEARYWEALADIPQIRRIRASRRVMGEDKILVFGGCMAAK